MAYDDQLGILKQGVQAWNEWRSAHPDVRPDLSGANLGGAHLTYRDDAWPANLPDTARKTPVLREPALQGINLGGARIDNAYFGQAMLQGANFKGAVGRAVDFREANLEGADFGSAAIQYSNFWGANLQDARFEGYANFYGTSFSSANLSRARLSRAQFSGVTLSHAILQFADLGETTLEGAVLTKADLSDATLAGADLRMGTLVETNLERAQLRGAMVYGISAWGLKLGGAEQADLIITPRDEPEVTVDELEVAQFIYLLLDNKKLRQVIDTVTSKAVLILGRFSAARKAVLDAVRGELRHRGYLPIVFDFEKPATRDLSETISTLGHLARFVIADITDARSIPQELKALVPALPSVPIQPVILESEYVYGMFNDFGAYLSVLPPFQYKTPEHLLASLDDRVIGPACERAMEIEARRKAFEAGLANS